MCKHRISLLMLLAASAIGMSATTFDNWKNYPAYGDITDIEPAGNMVYVLSSGDLFSYNLNDNSVSTYDKVYPLSDCDISRIAWNSTAKRLIIVYADYNIDLLDNAQNTVNISAYKDKQMTTSKTVNNLVLNGNYAYLCTAFGLVQVDMAEGVIRETFNIGKNTTNCAFSGSNIYVQTSDGTYKGSTTDNLIDPANWVETADAVSFSHQNDITVSWDNGYTQYTAYDRTNKCYWTNQSDNKLQAYTMAADGTKTVTHSDINPVAPTYNYFGYMKIHNGKVYACNGYGWDMQQPAALQIYNPTDESWTCYDNSGVGQKYNVDYKDLLCLAIDPADEQHVMAGAQTGLYEFRNGTVVNHFDNSNSPINYVSGLEGNARYQIVTSLFYDTDNTLLVATHAPTDSKPFHKYSTSGTWTTMDVVPSGITVLNAKFMGKDNSSSLWLNTGRYSNPAVVCYSADYGTAYTYKTYVNEDGTSIANIESVKALAEDKDGNIWVGTNVGLLLLNDEYQRNPSLGFYQVKVPRNDGTNYADYLLSGIDINTIAIDNANRKWVGTTNQGVYVISSDNMTQEAHLQAESSCLLSDAVYNISIDKQTGRVYIGTDKGLCSVESNATETFDSMDKDNVWAYPNPVRPDYTGLITIVGLSFDADVKITTTNGALVAQGRSTGGSFQWDGRDLKGKRVASGIYMVNTATESGDKGTVCKIAVIN